MRRRFIGAALLLLFVLIVGTVGFWLIGRAQHSVLDALYMTVVTISTIGYGEIIEVSGNPSAMAFTVGIAVSGIGSLLYIITNLTALIVEGDLTKSFRRGRMEKKARGFSQHYIVCGRGGVELHIVDELSSTGRPYVIVSRNVGNVASNAGRLGEEVWIEGDATVSETLTRAGIERAKGLFAVTTDDNVNLVISLTAKQLNPKLRVVAQCNEIRNSEKIGKAGADAVVCPGFIGGLRMASEMIRPTAVSFLDMMLRDKERNLRVEEISVPEEYAGKTVSALNMRKHPHILLLAVRAGDDWIYNPPDNHTM